MDEPYHIFVILTLWNSILAPPNKINFQSNNDSMPNDKHIFSMPKTKQKYS